MTLGEYDWFMEGFPMELSLVKFKIQLQIYFLLTTGSWKASRWSSLSRTLRFDSHPFRPPRSGARPRDLDGGFNPRRSP